MPTAKEHRQSRRDAVKIFTRIGQNLPTPERLNRDASKDALQAFVDKVAGCVDTPQEKEELVKAIAMWNGDGDQGLFLPGVPPLPRPRREAAEPPTGPRVHCSDVQLTFNGDFLDGQPAPRSASKMLTVSLLSPFQKTAAEKIALEWSGLAAFAAGLQVTEWWPVAGQLLARSFLEWSTRTFPSRFAEPLKHISLTIEESTNAESSRVHLHAQFTFERRIDRTCLV